jgi:hypothetical protein
MTEQSSAGKESSSPARSVAGLVVANTSLIAAILIYMGWSYDNALYARFHLNPLDLGLGPQEYALRSLSLFSPVIVLFAVLLIVVMSVRAGGESGAVRDALLRACRALLPATGKAADDDDASGDDARDDAGDPAGVQQAAAERPEQVSAEKQAEQAPTRRISARTLTVGGGVAVTAAGLALYWISTRVNVSTFLVLALLGGGPLLLTWPARANQQGRMPYALALVIAAVCALWAASVYAEQKGAEAAQSVIHDLPTSGAVVIYSTQRLALSGGGVTVTPLTTSAPYRYEYLGLRLLLMQSGTYYLLPELWTPQHDYTYIVYASDDTRIVLY